MPRKTDTFLSQIAVGAYGDPSLINSDYAKGYGQLAGKTVRYIELARAEDSNEYQPVIVFTDGTAAFVMCDDEGNGPGALDIVRPVQLRPKSKGTESAAHPFALTVG